MKPYEVRAAGMTEDYFKLDRFDPRIGTFRPTRGSFRTEAEARAAAKGGRFRVVSCSGRKAAEGEPFDA
jgi:hypothetical protein